MSYSTSLLSNVPLNISFIGPAFQILDSAGYAVQAYFSGSTCSFSIELQVSTDPYNNTPGYTPLHWDVVPNSLQTITQAGTFTWDVSPSRVIWVRLVVTDNSGGTNNGTIGANAYIKGPL